jgi:predicted RNase H-like nuclease
MTKRESQKRYNGERRSAFWRVGVDGCKAGWFYVTSNGEQFFFGIVSSVAELMPLFPDVGRIVIDIPIGLHDKGSHPRTCDIEARKLLKPRGSTVFPSPVRPCLYAASYIEACEVSEQLTGKKLSKQAYSIFNKIREVDELLIDNPKLQAVIGEAHPELGFCMLNNKKPLLSKKKRTEGIQQRLNLLKKKLESSEEIYCAALDRYPRKYLARDDIVDALMCLCIALASDEKLKTVPAVPAYDQSGLPMQMLYTE